MAPSFDATWFRSQQACANSGKRLCTNAEWQMAASGTPDPGNGTSEECVTNGSSVGATGIHPLCVGRFGAMDMIGNAAEWVSDWIQAGPNSTGTTWDMPSNPWPTNFPPDQTLAVNGTGLLHDGSHPTGAPVALVRGGAYNDRENAGTFQVDAVRSPAYFEYWLGFRSCASR